MIDPTDRLTRTLPIFDDRMTVTYIVTVKARADEFDGRTTDLIAGSLKAWFGSPGSEVSVRMNTAFRKRMRLRRR